jgi:hypothetical protein
MKHLSKDTLIAKAEQLGIHVGPKATKDMIIRAIQEFRAEKQREAERRQQARLEQRLQAEQAALDLHRQTRSHAMRSMKISVEEGLECLEYPLEFLGEYGGTAGIFHPLITDTSIVVEDLAGFPTQIREFLWVHLGENDADSWLAVGILENGVYFFYKGECDYTGFDCQGDMTLYGARSLPPILDSAMGIKEYDLWIQETTPYVE